jgi:hypothetical protein
LTRQTETGVDEHDLELRHRLFEASGSEVTEGELVDPPTLKRLARLWYGDRLRADWRPRTREQSHAILDGVGLTGPFWRLG